MKKSLKLLFALSTIVTLPLSVIACSQQDLDSTLKLIYDNTDTKYDIKDLLEGQTTDQTITEKVLSITDSNTMVKMVAEKILNTTPIVWFDDSLAVDTICYNFNITNGKKEDNNITWEVKVIDERIEVKVEYLVGKVKTDKTFEAKQRITKTFNIKVGASNSDKIVNTWISSFNSSVAPNQITVDLTSKDITIPTAGGWSDLGKDVVTVIYEAVAEKVPAGVSTWVIQSNNESITNGELTLIIAASLNDAKANTNPFTIKFV